MGWLRRRCGPVGPVPPQMDRLVPGSEWLLPYRPNQSVARRFRFAGLAACLWAVYWDSGAVSSNGAHLWDWGRTGLGGLGLGWVLCLIPKETGGGWSLQQRTDDNNNNNNYYYYCNKQQQQKLQLQQQT